MNKMRSTAIKFYFNRFDNKLIINIHQCFKMLPCELVLQSASETRPQGLNKGKLCECFEHLNMLTEYNFKLKQ